MVLEKESTQLPLIILCVSIYVPDVVGVNVLPIIVIPL